MDGLHRLSPVLSNVVNGYDMILANTDKMNVGSNAESTGSQSAAAAERHCINMYKNGM